MSSVRGNKNRPFLNGRNNTVPMVSTGSSSRSAGSIPDSRHQNDIDSSFSDLLERITKGGNSGDSLLDLLNSLGIDQDKGLTGGQRDDWNKQLLDTLINYALEKDKRGYNEQLRDEQRLYDTPTNQLARLMGAGISRDAALQLLGQGNEPIQTEGAQTPEGLAPSESRANEMQANLAPLNATLDVIGAVSSLVGLGFSIPQAISQANILRTQAYMSQQQRVAFDSVNLVSNALQTAVNDGVISQDDFDSWSNGNDAYSWMLKNRDNSVVSPLIKSGAFQGAFGSTYGREMFNKHWNEIRSSRDSGTLLDELIRGRKLDNFIKNLDASKISAELENIDADTFLKTAQSQEVFARICLIDSQSAHEDALTELTQAQTIGQNFTNGNLRMEYELNSAGFPMLKQVYIDELSDEVLRWSLIKDKDVRDARMTRWMNDEQNANKAAWLEAVKLNASGNFAAAHPMLYELIQGFNSTGGSAILHSTAQTAGSAIKGLFKAFLKVP